MLRRQLWYKSAIIYCLDVETFQDSNGDGIGDFPGLLSQLDYLSGLGINCIWLLPFYPTPNRDNGFDNVNAADQQLDKESLLNWMDKAIRVRKDAPEFSNGGTRILESGNPSVLIHRCEGENSL